jgi:hypothetical protein
MNGWIFVISFSAYSHKLKFVWISLHFIYSEPFTLVDLSSDSSLYDYADNTLSFCNPDFDALISTLETNSNQLI